MTDPAGVPALIRADAVYLRGLTLARGGRHDRRVTES
jgi:hypothetical protein